MSFTADAADILKHDDKSDLTSSARSVLQELGTGGKTAGAIAQHLEWPLTRAQTALDLLRDAGLVRSRPLSGQQQVVWFIPAVTVVPDIPPARLSRAAQRELMATRYAALAMAKELIPNALTQTQLAVALWLLGDARLDPKA